MALVVLWEFGEFTLGRVILTTNLGCQLMVPSKEGTQGKEVSKLAIA